MKYTKLLTALLTTLALASSGCLKLNAQPSGATTAATEESGGGGGGGGGSDPAPTTLSYSTNPATYTKGTAITNNVPTTDGLNVTYSISPSLNADTGLSFSTVTGVISGTPTSTHVATAYTITATNSGGFKNVSVTITVNEAAPTTLSYSTNPATYTKGAAITNNTPTTDGANVTYSISPDLNAATGLSFSTVTGVISGTPTSTIAATAYTITATNSGGFKNVSVTITVNEAAPTTLSYSTNPATYTKGVAITNNTPTTNGANVTYSITPNLNTDTGLSFSTVTGIISGTPTSTHAATAYTITATNSGGFKDVSVTITVNEAAPTTLSYSTNPATYTKNVAITNNTPTTDGANVTYSITPNLNTDTGLSFSTVTGIISGTPTSTHAATAYTITATNSGGFKDVSVTITVNEAAPTTLSYSTNPATYTKGVAITDNTPTTNGANVTYSITPDLNADTGLSFSTVTGIISGTPTSTHAATAYTITATNSGGFKDVSVTITVNEAAPTTLSYSTNPATYAKNTAITNNTPTTNGANVTYSITPDLNADTGLSFSAVTGVISGTPTSTHAATAYTITATNSGGFKDVSVTITVTEAAPTTLSYSTNPASYTKGVAITNNTPTTNGANVTYSITPNLNTDTGLSFSTVTGVISGTPTAGHAATDYTITATNSGGSKDVTVNITVLVPAPTLLSYTLSNVMYVNGTAIPNNSPTTDGQDVTYSITPNLNTNTGLSFSTVTGVISGTPSTLSASTAYTITATNTGGSKDVTIYIGVANGFVVNSTADTGDFSTADGFCDTNDSAGDGPCTLRAAVQQANAVATAGSTRSILLPSGTITVDTTMIALGSANLANLTITGQGVGVSIISGGNTSPRVFDKSTAVNVTISDVTMSGGRDTGNGGFIRNNSASGTMTLRNCLVTGNAITSTGQGGGAIGGGVAGSTTVIDNCTVTGNSSPDYAAAIGTYGTLTITNSTISSNTLTNAGGQAGGAVWSQGVLNITNSTFDSNSGGAAAGGGAIYLSSGANMTSNGSTFSNNTSPNAGGAIYMMTNSFLTANDTTFNGNTSTISGGAIYQVGGASGSTTLNRVAFFGNTGQFGSAFALNSGTATFTNVTISNNTTTGPSAAISTEGSNGSISIRQSTIANNTSPAGGSGGIHVAATDTITLIQSIIAGNTVNGGADNCVRNGTLTASAYNLSDTAAADCNLTGTSIPSSSISDLATSIGNNGGSVNTVLIQSPTFDGVDAVPAASCHSLLDARSVVRPRDGDGDTTADCDIGAYEL